MWLCTYVYSYHHCHTVKIDSFVSLNLRVSEPGTCQSGHLEVVAWWCSYWFGDVLLTDSHYNSNCIICPLRHGCGILPYTSVCVAAAILADVTRNEMWGASDVQGFKDLTVNLIICMVKEPLTFIKYTQVRHFQATLTLSSVASSGLLTNISDDAYRGIDCNCKILFCSIYFGWVRLQQAISRKAGAYCLIIPNTRNQTDYIYR